jgi:hypothetical protein
MLRIVSALAALATLSGVFIGGSVGSPGKQRPSAFRT